MSNNEKVLYTALAAFVVLILAPFAYIWAWNQLFSQFLFIEYGFWNWLAVAILSGLLRVSVKSIREN